MTSRVLAQQHQQNYSSIDYQKFKQNMSANTFKVNPFMERGSVQEVNRSQRQPNDVSNPATANNKPQIQNQMGKSFAKVPPKKYKNPP